ncbi:Oidioi.mRNA.OKI2018_I69.XSR.g16107.t2.cds [Oikopleura dioica]|uniref:Oidioi.mRNA.OKI2018_I69.XSR.g16107.t2.cds n=1 Tax=Oikopleura dioica TaxID=34765 RepID=A0ABN7SJZ3_OIKDI|nr:Oidioi.mRNA.OKI2018_I69.XSR.g16107.t2.cds [Oikopleura dioica]
MFFDFPDLPSMMTTIESMKTDDELSQTVELVECGKAENTPKIESFVINTPNSVNPGTSGNLQNSQTTFQFQQTASGHEITYIDENDGTHIGENDEDGIELITSEECEPPTKTRVLDASSQNITFQTVSNSSNQKFIQIPQTNQTQQILQIQNGDGQTSQIMIIPQNSIFVIPQQGGQNGGQQILLLQSPQANQTTTSNPVSPSQKVKVVKVSENSSSINLVEDAAGIAGIKPTQTTLIPPGQRVEFNKEVSTAHIYPSPFSQVPHEDRPHSCSFCYKRFARADECKRHERIHTDTRPFACQYCTRKFTRKDHLRTHTRCHTKEKPYVCPICNRGFARSDERIRHAKTHVKKGDGTLEEIKKAMPKPKFDTNKNHTSSPSNHSPVQQQSPQNSHQTPHLVLNQINGTVSVAGSTGQESARQILTNANGQAIELKLQSPMDDLGLSNAISKQIPIKVIQTVPLQSVQTTDASGQQTVVREVTINDS